MKRVLSIFLVAVLFSCNLQAMFVPTRLHSKLLLLCRQQSQRTICTDCPAMETVWSKLDTQRYGALTREHYFELEMKKAEGCASFSYPVDAATTLRIAELSEAALLNNRKSVNVATKAACKNCPYKDSKTGDILGSKKIA